jgi:two-component system chemotaxis response regulator CheY
VSYSFLVVDDSPLVRKMVKRALGMSKLEVGTLFEAGNGVEALAILHKEWVDLVFADIHMPEMDGIEMIERMAADPVLANVPVVVCSTERGEERVEKLRKLGVRSYITKPFTPETILETVTQLLKRVEGPPHA